MTKKCEHGRQKYFCKDCKGNGICEHGKRRSDCKKCGGSQICEHNKPRNRCKGCAGVGICQHGRVRSRCKECGGSQICQHGRIRSRCKECGGGGVCEHKRIRSQCRECGGGKGRGGLCEHGRVRGVCTGCCPEGAYKKYKREAKRRELSFELTFEEFKWLISWPCSSCGESLGIGVDRIDSDKGYSFANCQSMCGTCNVMKFNHSEGKFDQQIIKIIQHRPELVQRAGFQVLRLNP